MVREQEEWERKEIQKQELMWWKQTEQEKSPAAQMGVSTNKTTYFGGCTVHLLFRYRSIIDKYLCAEAHGCS